MDEHKARWVYFAWGMAIAFSGSALIVLIARALERGLG